MKRVVVGVTVLASLACGGTAPTVPAALPGATPPPPAPVPVSLTAAAPATSPETRIDGVITACLNRFSQRGYDSRERYLSWVDGKTGPTGREPIVYGLYDFPLPIADCREAIDRMVATPPLDPELDAAARGYADALVALDGRIQDATPYYEQERWRDDAFARGRALHAPLMTAFDNFVAADRALARVVDARLDAIDDAATDRLGPNPSSEALLRRVLRSARGAMQTIAKVEERPDGQLDGPLAELDTRLRDLAATTDALAKWEHDRLAPDAEGLDGFVDAARDLEGSVRQVATRIRNHEPLGDTYAAWCGSSSGWMVEGCPDQVLRAYETLVDDVNRSDRLRPTLLSPVRGR